MLIRRLIAAFLVLASLSGQAYAGCICPMAFGSAPPPDCCQPAAHTSDCTQSGNLSSCGVQASAGSALLVGGGKSDHLKSFAHQPFDPPVIATGDFRFVPAVFASASPLRRELSRPHHALPLYLETARLRL
ncbi:MAG: hypothetical protein ISP90_15035 [Nevskia sp.]|nr:hypothetical protein [Nevskia sp.]